MVATVAFGPGEEVDPNLWGWGLGKEVGANARPSEGRAKPTLRLLKCGNMTLTSA